MVESVYQSFSISIIRSNLRDVTNGVLSGLFYRRSDRCSPCFADGAETVFYPSHSGWSTVESKSCVVL